MATFNLAGSAEGDRNATWSIFLDGMRHLSGADLLLLTASPGPSGMITVGQSGAAGDEDIKALTTVIEAAWSHATAVVIPDTIRDMGNTACVVVDGTGAERIVEELAEPLEAPFRTMAAIPLWQGRNVVGVLAIGWTQPTADLTGILQPFSCVARLAAMALGSPETNNEASDELLSLTSLTEVGRRLNQRLEMPAVLQVVLDTAVSLADVPSAGIYLKVRGGAWRLEMARGLKEAQQREIETALLALDARADVRMRVEIPPYLLLPLSVKEEVVGCLAVGREEPFAAFERSLLYMLSQQATTAILHHQAAFYDDLTGFPNQVYVNRLIERHMVEHPGQGLTLLRLDLDGFKRVNDVAGVDAADAFLVELAGRLRQVIPQVALLGRTTSDEFDVVLPGLREMSQLEPVALALLDEVRQPAQVLGHEVAMTASVGIARYPEDAATTELLRQRADLALYAAKRRGQDMHAFYERGMSERLGARMAMEARLRQAIFNRRLHLHYQPQIDESTGRMVAVEALARWSDGQHGNISPGVFIPLAEETGLIVPLGEWLTVEAARQANNWAQAGVTALRVSINVSAIELQRPGFTEHIEELVRGEGCAPRLLELEITESATMHNPKQILDVLHRLRAAGFRIAIDDFGTGWSSLSYLVEYPVDILKVDQSFVRRVVDEPKARAVVATIVRLTEALGVEVIAEGVETLEQALVMRDLGCSFWQGYLLSRPVPPEQIDWNQRWSIPGISQG